MLVLIHFLGGWHGNKMISSTENKVLVYTALQGQLIFVKSAI